MSNLSPVSHKQLVRVFEADGFHHVRTEGDHMVFTKSGVIWPERPGFPGERYFELLGR